MTLDPCVRRRLSWLPIAGTVLLIGFFWYQAVKLRQEMTRQQQRAELYLHIIDNSTSAVVVINNKGQVTEWSQRATEIFGWTAAEAIGSSIEFLMPPKDRLPHRAAFAKVVHGGNLPRTTRIIDCWALTKSGKLTHVSIRVSAVKSTPTSFLAIIDKHNDVKTLEPLPKPASDWMPPADLRQFKAPIQKPEGKGG